MYEEQEEDKFYCDICGVEIPPPPLNAVYGLDLICIDCQIEARELGDDGI